MEKKPDWLKVRYNQDAVNEVAELMRDLKLNTVCKEANCPNLGECYRKHTSTFMILGSVCTRNCRFCNVTTGHPLPPDPEEPMHVARAAKKLGLRHEVLTCSTRDDLPDGGAGQFAACVRAIRENCPGTTVETLISDMKGDHAALDTVIAAHPEVLNHNVETVRELQQAVRPQARYERSLGVLRYCKEQDPSLLTKTGFMVGLGETEEQISRLMDDILATGCDILTIGQYLQPSPRHYPLARYATPEDFARWKELALAKGFRHVASAICRMSVSNSREPWCTMQSPRRYWALPENLRPSMVRSLRPLKAAETPISPRAPMTGAMYWLNSISPAARCWMKVNCQPPRSV